MVLDNKQTTTIAYRCPHCGAGVMSVVDIFALSSPMVKLKCDCGESEMVMVKENDGKMRLSVPCIICPKPHTFLLGADVLLEKDILLLQCPYSEVDVCCIGEAELVKANLARGEYELIKIMEENGISDFSALREANDTDDDDAFDSELTQNVIFGLSELEAENKIFCRCEHKDGVDEEKYGFEVHSNGVLVKCRDCGAEHLIPTDNSLRTHAFLDADALYLE